jgi:hypothetical protein
MEMDRNSVLVLRNQPGYRGLKQAEYIPRPFIESIPWTLLERVLSFLSPVRLDLRIKEPGDTLNYHYRINRKGVDYPSPETDTAYITNKAVHIKRSATAVFEAHLIACRPCAEATSEGILLCVVGIELERRMEYSTKWHRKATSDGESGGIYINGRRAKL